MPSSYNIIKHSNIIHQGNKEIITKVDNTRKQDAFEIENIEEISELELAYTSDLIQKAQMESSEILLIARQQAEALQKEAYERGYSTGYEEGTSQGYNDAYNKTIKVAEADAAEIIKQANTLLLNAKLEYEAYLEAKTNEIKQLAISMAEKVLRKELEKDDGLNNMILEVLSDSRNAKSFIIRASQAHVDEIRKNMDEWKENIGLKGEIFIVADESLGPYYAIVEKNNGSVEIGLDSGMEGIKRAIS